MTEGELRLPDGRTATAGPDGWRSGDAGLASLLKALYPPPASVAGVPWVRAFWGAVDGLGAEAAAEPEADVGPGIDGGPDPGEEGGNQPRNPPDGNQPGGADSGLSNSTVPPAGSAPFYDPDEPREPAGSPGGGQWAAGAGGASYRPGSGEGRLYATRKGAGEADGATRLAHAEARRREAAVFGPRLEGGEAEAAMRRDAPELVDFALLARDVARANTSSKRDLVLTYNPGNVTALVQQYDPRSGLSYVLALRPSRGGVLVSSDRSGRRAGIPEDASEEEASRILHRVLKAPPPPRLSNSTVPPTDPPRD